MSQTTGIVRPAVDDRADLDDLYMRDMPGAVRLAALITGDADLAQDIAHDAFLRSVGRFRHLRQPEAFEAYLRRAVVNACTSYFRRRKVEAAYLRGQARHPAPVDEPDHGRRDELRAALSALPPRQRARRRAPVLRRPVRTAGGRGPGVLGGRRAFHGRPRDGVASRADPEE